MQISPEEASETLSQIADAQTRSKALNDYWCGAPHFFVWGILWMAGFGLTGLFPAYVTVIWGVVALTGLTAGGAINRSQEGEGGTRDRRYVIIALAFAIFFFAVFSIMKPHSINQTSAFVCLIVALTYVLMGLWFGVRYIISGVLVAALTLAGFFLLPGYFSLWMASVGGSALILTGLWLRKP